MGKKKKKELKKLLKKVKLGQTIIITEFGERASYGEFRKGQHLTIEEIDYDDTNYPIWAETRSGAGEWFSIKEFILQDVIRLGGE